MEATDRIYATDREPQEFCTAGTEGCAIDHTAEFMVTKQQGSCESW